MKFASLSLVAGLCWGLASVAVAQVGPNPMPNPQLPQPGQGQPQPGQPQPQFGQPPPNMQGAQNAAAINEFLLKNFDRDGDGKLNPQEKLMGTRALQERGHRVPGMPNIARGSSNGPISNQAPPQQPQPKQKKLSRRDEILLKRFDKDGDGKLNEEEKEAARAELGQKDKSDKK